MGDQTGAGEFDATLEEVAGVCVVCAIGELDMGTACELKGKLDEAIGRCERAGGVVADLSQVEFMESTGLGMLVRQREDLRNSGKELAVVIQGSDDDTSREEHPVGKLLHLTEQAGQFTVYDGRAAAVESVAPGSR